MIKLVKLLNSNKKCELSNLALYLKLALIERTEFFHVSSPLSNYNPLFIEITTFFSSSSFPFQDFQKILFLLLYSTVTFMFYDLSNVALILYYV